MISSARQRGHARFVVHRNGQWGCLTPHYHFRKLACIAHRCRKISDHMAAGSRPVHYKLGFRQRRKALISHNWNESKPKLQLYKWSFYPFFLSFFEVLNTTNIYSSINLTKQRYSSLFNPNNHEKNSSVSNSTPGSSPINSSGGSGSIEWWRWAAFFSCKF